MFIRRSFDEFLKVQSDQDPAPTAATGLGHRLALAVRLPENADFSFPSERSLVDCSAWAKPKTQKPA